MIRDVSYCGSVGLLQLPPKVDFVDATGRVCQGCVNRVLGAV